MENKHERRRHPHLQALREISRLRDISLEVQTGELLALLGPSGSGKTTLLRIIAGLEIPDEGRVLFAGEDVTDKSAYARRAGFVFQAYALFQHMTVFENIAFGLRVTPRRSRPNAQAIRKRVTELLQLIQLEGYEARLPSQLSGGQRQRVALAARWPSSRACCCSTSPSARLMRRCARDLRKWLRHFHDQTHLTSLFVTHDQEEAFELADRASSSSTRDASSRSARRSNCATSPRTPSSAISLRFSGSILWHVEACSLRGRVPDLTARSLESILLNMARKIESWIHLKIEEAGDFALKIVGYSEREVVIYTCSIIDTLLADLLATALRPNEVEVENFLGLDANGQAPLGSFGSRIQAAYLLNLIDELDLKIYRIFKHIRNRFAHNASVSFADADIVRSRKRIGTMTGAVRYNVAGRARRPR